MYFIRVCSPLLFFRESSLLFHHPKSGECYFREKFSHIDERRWNLSSRLIYFMNKRFTRCRARVFVTGCRMAASNSGFCGVRGDKLSEEERCGEVLKMLGNFRRRLRASRDARNTFWFKGSCFSRFDRFRDCDREIFCGRWIMLNVDLFLSIWISKYIFLRINVACEFVIILHHFIPLYATDALNIYLLYGKCYKKFRH